MQDIGGGMRLVASHAKRQADVAKIRGYVIVERLDLVKVAAFVPGEFGGLGSDFGRGLATVFLQAAVPDPQIRPAGEGGQLDRRRLRLGRFVCLLLVLILVVALEMRTLPAVNLATVFFADLGID